MNVFYQASALCKSTQHKHDGESVKMVKSSFLTMGNSQEQSSCQLDWSNHVFDALLISFKLRILFAPSSDSVVDAVIDKPLVVVGNAVRNVAELVFLP